MSRELMTRDTVAGDRPRRRGSDDLPRVLVVSGQNGGGIWHYTCLLSQALIELGVDVALTTTFPFEPLHGIEKVPIWSLGTQPAETSPLPVRVSRHVASHAGKLRRLAQLLASFRPGIVHLQDQLGQVDFLYLKLLKRVGIRIVFTAHDPRPLSGRNNWLDRARYHEADAILVHSRNGVQELISDGVIASKITQIAHPNYLHFCGGNNLSRDEARYALGIPPSARTILFFGTIAPYKGLDTLLQGFSQVSKEDPQAHLTIAGEPLEDFAPYQSLVERLGLTERVLLDLRHIPFAEFPKYFCSADVVVLPHRRIYQSGILQLAYGFGRPVVVTDAGGLGETVSEDQTGVIAAAEDPRSLAFAMRRLLADQGAAAEMGKRGRHLAETKYSWNAMAKEVTKVYRSVYDNARLRMR